nr:porin [uncultured bacterium]
MPAASEPAETVVEPSFPAEAADESYYAPGLFFQNTTLTPAYETALGVFLYRDETGRYYNAGTDQLPPAADPNDFHANPLHAPPALSMAAQSRLLHFLVAPTGAAYDSSAPRLSYGLQIRPGVFYDTGAFEDESIRFRPGRIALDGTDDAHRRGRIYFNELENSLQSLPARLQFNASFAFFGIDAAQAYVDAIHSTDNSLRGRSAFIRSYAGDTGVLLGKAESAFGDLSSAPMLITTGGLPIGAVGVIDESTNNFTSVPQLRFTRHWNDDRLETTFTIEEQQLLDDVDYAGEVPHFWPTFVGRIRLQGADDFNSLQLAALIRPIGFNDDAFEDHAVTGWGLSAIARFCNAARTDAVYFGVVGGRGIGGYIFGDIQAAIVPTPTTIETLENFGAYVAYQRVWGFSDAIQNLSSNFACGYVSADPVRPADNRELFQAWCNLLWNATDSSAFGVEYQYGRREVGDERDGDNHRIAFVAQFSTPSSRELNEQVRLTRAESGGPRPLDQRRL